jgi:hypothetical protein
MRETNSSRNYETRQSEYPLRASLLPQRLAFSRLFTSRRNDKELQGGRVMKPKKQTEKLLELIGDGLAMSPDEVARLQKNLRGLRSLCQRAQAAKDCGILQSLGTVAMDLLISAVTGKSARSGKSLGAIY